MELTRSQIGSVLVLAFAEPISLEGENSERFKEKIRATIAEGRRNLVVDLRQVEFIDSSGLGALISALKILRASGGDLRLACPSEAVRSVLELTRLLRVFDVHPEAESALRSFEEIGAAVESD